jgi:hypothetical protein
MRQAALALMLAALLGTAGGATLAEAGNRGPHPVIAWKGNEYLFETKQANGATFLSGYRSVGHQWQYVGTFKAGEAKASGGFLKRIWLNGKRVRMVEADLSNPYWRRYPAEDHEGHGGQGVFN